MAVSIFWLSIALVVYVYAGYPVLAKLLGAVTNRRVKTADPGAYRPTVTVAIAAFNEAAHIEATVRNKLASDYPADKLQVVVVSDGSDDGTDAIVQGIDDPRVRLVRQEPRAGKTSGLNLILPDIDTEVVVFSDANSLYHADTIGHLVAPLADPEVGYVTGRMVYRAPDGSLTGEGCSAYMVYENRLREWETRLGSIVGVDGGVDAVRRELWTPMRPDQLPDFVEPLSIREQGYRVVYEPRALLYEDALAAEADEFRMRVRVTLRAYHALKDKAALLNPLRFGLFAWQLWSHKVLRYLAFLGMLGAMLANLVLAWQSGGIWSLFFAGQIVFYVTAGYGRTMLRQGHTPPRLAGLAYYLCVLNLASALAFVQFLRGKKQVTWKPRT
ncbi:glycosyltransferase family 2 protein [bacterium]|nr:MAG: glycosyltransferase family 2 protein [bacterium]